MLVNPYDIPLVVTITNGSKNDQILVPEKGRTNITVGFRLSEKDKRKYPKLVDTEANKPKPVQTVSVSEPVKNSEPVETVVAEKEEAPESENAVEAQDETKDSGVAEDDKSTATGKETLRLSTRKKS